MTDSWLQVAVAPQLVTLPKPKDVFSSRHLLQYLSFMIQISAIPSTLLSCQIGEVTILTDHSSVEVEFSTPTETLLSGKFYAYNGKVYLHDLRSLIEQVIKATGFSVERFNLCAAYGDEEAETTFTAVHCDRDIDIYNIDPLFLNHFLTPASSRRIAPNSFVFVSWFARKNERLAYHIYCDYIADGKPEHTSFIGGYANVNAVEDNVMTIAILCGNVQKRASELAKQEVELVAFTVRCGNRATTFFIDSSLADGHCFYFRNAFNAPDQIFIPAVATAKTTTDRPIAVLLDTSQFYDSIPMQEFELQSAALTSDECLLSEQLFTSEDVRIPYENQPYDADFDALRPILITESTCEIADLSEKPNCVKFTWRHNRNCIAMPNPIGDGIFTEPYNFIFK